MGVELKPCPFCGGTAHIEQPGTRRQSCVVECDSCGLNHESGDEGEMCGTSWNRREGEAARIQQQALNYESLLAQHTASLERIDELELKAKQFISLQAQCDDHLARIAELEKERDALKADGERLDSGCIVTYERDEFGAEYECERRGVDLRARIDAAMEINKRQSERPDWAECESRGPLVRNSLKHRTSELTTATNKCRRAYQEDFMRIPLEWLVDAYDEAAAALNRRLSSIAALQAEKETRS